jgi:glycosyltransferase EpsD
VKYHSYIAAEKLTAKVTDVLLTMNQWDYEMAKKHRLGVEVKKIPGMGVDYTMLRPTQTREAFRKVLREQYGIPENAFLILYAAEFSKRKNQKLLIDAMRALPENVYAILAGDGDQRGKCERYSSQLGLNQRVAFPGYIN